MNKKFSHPLSTQDRAELIARLRAAQDAATDENEKNLLRAKRLRLEAGKVRETGVASLIREMGGEVSWSVVWDGEIAHYNALISRAKGYLFLVLAVKKEQKADYPSEEMGGLDREIHELEHLIRHL